MRDFRKLDVWRLSLDLAAKVYEICPEIKKYDRFGIADQMTRAAVSIPSNIAEGCRGSEKEIADFLNIALGASFELETQLIIIRNGMDVSAETIVPLLADIQVLQKRINAYRSYIIRQNPSQYPNTLKRSIATPQHPKRPIL